jgi:hypothetical protein
MSYRSNFESIGGGLDSDPDILYYNASIVNNNTKDLINGFAFQDPLVRFNETRDQAIIKDASKYQFSIVRFVVNGGNLDLPLFIPSIQSSTGQYDPNLTEYGFGISLGIPLENTDGSTTIYNICPAITYLEYYPENLNPVLAPTPLPPCAPQFAFNIPSTSGVPGLWDITNAYPSGAIVATNADFTSYSQSTRAVPAGTPLSGTYTQNGQVLRFWNTVSSELGRPQDISSRYYWVNTFQHMVDMVNTTMETANLALYNGLLTGYLATPGNLPANFPFNDGAGNPSYDGPNGFTAIFPTPVMNYDINSGLFNIVYPATYSANDTLFPTAKIGLWMNANSYGLFANFPAEYYNKPGGDGSLGAVVLNAGPFLPGYTYKMNVEYLNLGANIVQYSPDFPVQPSYTGNFLRMTQEYISTSTLWSPVDSIVFVSNLLPIQNEQTAPPNVFGVGNVGNSQAVVPSAFQPIITDVAQALGNDPAGWRKMLYYSPSAEYRMADFQNSKAGIKNIDVQVFWKNRLNNQLYPLSMYNLSSVSIKIMFRKKNMFMGGLGKSEKQGMY